ncbi:MAG TPA: preprotein translocase subunit SecE [Candidatus Saccharimonadales bacterium]
MADSDKPAKKRRLRAPAETVREKAEKALGEAAKPKKRSKLRKLFTPLRIFVWLAHRPPLKQIGHGLRWFFSLRIMRFIGKILGVTYVYESWHQLRLVTWPTRRESRRLTIAVIIFSVIFGGLIYVVDLGLDKVFKAVVLR